MGEHLTYLRTMNTPQRHHLQYGITHCYPTQVNSEHTHIIPTKQASS